MGLFSRNEPEDEPVDPAEGIDAVDAMEEVADGIKYNLKRAWQIYTDIFEEIKEHGNNKQMDEAVNIIVDLENTLIDLTDQIAGQLYLATGLWEPIPTAVVEDFESSVLTDIANLDKVDLDMFRTWE